MIQNQGLLQIWLDRINIKYHYCFLAGVRSRKDSYTLQQNSHGSGNREVSLWSRTWWEERGGRSCLDFHDRCSTGAQGMQASASAWILTRTYTLRVVLVTAIEDPRVGQHKAWMPTTINRNTQNTIEQSTLKPKTLEYELKMPN